MAAYSQLLGAAVRVQYRLGDILLTACGILAADSGRSIFLEERMEQRGKRSYFRWEIPYRYIHRLERAGEAEETQALVDCEPALAAKAAAAAASAGDATSAQPGGITLPQSRQPA